MTKPAPSTPGVSVVIPMFNSAAHVGEAIASVLAQTHPVLEVIAVDDGSADDSAAIAGRFGPPVTVVRREHAGQGATRNAGARRARGELLAFLDSDDVWLPGKLAVQIAALAAEGCDMVFGGVEQFKAGGDRDASAENLDHAERRGLLVSAMVVRRTAFECVGGFREDVTFGEFIDWYARAQEAGLRACTVNEIVIRRRIHEGNTGVRERSSRRQYVRVVKDVLDRRAAVAGDRPAHGDAAPP